MNKLRSLFILMAAFLGACASVDEPRTSTATPAASDTLQASPTPSATGQPERYEPTTPATSRAPVTPATISTPGKNSVYFDFDRDDIRPEFRPVIEEHAKYLHANPGLRVRVEGNADERGSREYNVALGQRRADAVMKSLEMLGVPGSRVEAVSNGEEKPRRTGHEEASWAENRRGDLLFLKD